MQSAPRNEELAAITDTYQGLIIGECIRALEQGVPRLIEVEDLVQEVHIRLWEKLPEVRRAKNRRGYVRVTARNAIENALRKLNGCPEPMEFREVLAP